MRLETGTILWVPRHVHRDFRYAFLFEILRARYVAGSGYWFLLGWELDEGRCRVRERGFWIAAINVDVVC